MYGFLIVTLELMLSSTALVTKRTLINNWVAFFGTLLGTIFGLLESFGSLMGFCERLVDKIEGKLERSRLVTKIMKERKNISSFMEDLNYFDVIRREKRDYGTEHPTIVEFS